MQALPSSHGLVLFVETQPVAGSQVSVVQGLLSSHVTADPAWQDPPPQVSPVVQAFPSLHVVPFALAGFEQTPVAVLQVPALWHWSRAVHDTGLVPTHTPALQLSV